MRLTFFSVRAWSVLKKTAVGYDFYKLNGLLDLTCNFIAIFVICAVIVLKTRRLITNG